MTKFNILFSFSPFKLLFYWGEYGDRGEYKQIDSRYLICSPRGIFASHLSLLSCGDSRRVPKDYNTHYS